MRSGDVDVLMFPLSAANDAMPDRQTLLSACLERNVGLIAMKPFAGGRLFDEDGRRLGRSHTLSDTWRLAARTAEEEALRTAAKTAARIAAKEAGDAEGAVGALDNEGILAGYSSRGPRRTYSSMGLSRMSSACAMISVMIFARALSSRARRLRSARRSSVNSRRGWPLLSVASGSLNWSNAGAGL